MSLFDQVIAAYPELADNRDAFINGTIILQDDSDGTGAYIREWNYLKPIPESLQQYAR
jgi:hypothetical protein